VSIVALVFLPKLFRHLIRFSYHIGACRVIALVGCNSLYLPMCLSSLGGGQQFVPSTSPMVEQRVTDFQFVQSFSC
jgi:hypothetical protein